MTIEELLAQLAQITQKADPVTRDALAKFAAQLKAFGAQTANDLAARDQTIADDATQIAKLNAQIAESDKVTSEQKAQLAAKDGEIAALKDQLAGSTQVTRASPSDLAKSFRAVINEFHAEAREADDVGVAIKTLDLEVKGLVEVDEQKTTFVLPSAGTAVDPTALSTMRVSFSTFPLVTAPAPAPSPPSPALKKPTPSPPSTALKKPAPSSPSPAPKKPSVRRRRPRPS